jgi:hypothetical protein
MTDYEEARLQPPTAGHPKGELLSTGCFIGRNLMLVKCSAGMPLL